MKMNGFSIRLKEIRFERGISLLELSLESGISDRSIYGYENGTRFPTLKTLIKIKNALGCTWDELLDGVYL